MKKPAPGFSSSPRPLATSVRINKSLCLDQCEHGPTIVVYPEAVWYGSKA